MIKANSLENLKAQIDIVDIISNSIELKKAGANFKACCPFHSESTPSFVVSPVKQIYNCFGGCGSGDAIKFVQEYKKLSFIEAVEDIANEMNFTLEYDNNSNLMEHINSFYLANLDQGINEYLLNRGLTIESIKTFEVGFAPSSNQQIDIIKREAFNMQDAQECGIVAVDDSNKTYARLTNRISFPIRNHTGKLIGFGGRIIKGDRAKYINSPQTKLFDKSRNLYGYNLAKEHIYKKGTFVITEGYLDVIMFHQAGIKTAVATMGTALTELHCNMIKKAQAKVLLCFDGDKAGIEAGFKASKLLSAHDIHGGVVIFPEGKDPADMVKDGNIEELHSIMRQKTPLIQFVINTIASRYSLNIPQQKQEALKEVSIFLRTLSSLIQDEYKPYVAQTLQINQSHIHIDQQQEQHYQAPATAILINIGEMNIIKTARENENMLNTVLDLVDVNMFDFHPKEFEMLRTGDNSLDGLLLADGLSTYTEAELLKQLKMMQISHHSKQLQNIIHSDESYEKKAFEMKKVKGIIHTLKKELSKKAS